MESCLFIGGYLDGLNFPVQEGQETDTVSVGVLGSETYIREELRVGDASVAIFRHESLTAEQVVALLIKFCKAWSVNRPGEDRATLRQRREGAKVLREPDFLSHARERAIYGASSKRAKFYGSVLYAMLAPRWLAFI
jgi:hypothetical protein